MISSFKCKDTQKKRRTRNLIHPGEILQEEFLAPLSISQTRLALDLHVPAPHINAIVRGKRAITADADEADRIILMVAEGFDCAPPSPPERKFDVPEDEWHNWHPNPPNIKITVANVNGRDLFLSDGYKLMPLQ